MSRDALAGLETGIDLNEVPDERQGPPVEAALEGIYRDGRATKIYSERAAYSLLGLKRIRLALTSLEGGVVQYVWSYDYMRNYAVCVAVLLAHPEPAEVEAPGVR